MNRTEWHPVHRTEWRRKLDDGTELVVSRGQYRDRLWEYAHVTANNEHAFIRRSGVPLFKEAQRRAEEYAATLN